MSRIEARFAALKQEGRAALVAFIRAGAPDPATALKILKGL
ncbi:MAG TPA: tryptophan synthase subunit alpha, partial [Aestuariivirga sp.]|nr:tryptophan synthase subunit alpha [Aestuariivirga sp.]